MNFPIIIRDRKLLFLLQNVVGNKKSLYERPKNRKQAPFKIDAHEKSPSESMHTTHENGDYSPENFVTGSARP